MLFQGPETFLFGTVVISRDPKILQNIYPQFGHSSGISFSISSSSFWDLSFLFKNA